ncbi:hypothetical protein MLD38_040759 [Melastoma candidum]|nr:hypothetical protein MLD38_040759 [Melastoma candidum]
MDRGVGGSVLPITTQSPFLNNGFHGPYGHELPYHLTSLILVAGGIGVSPFFAISSDILHLVRTEQSCQPKDVLLIWAIKKSDELSLLSMLDMDESSPSLSDKLNLKVQTHVTRESEPPWVREAKMAGTSAPAWSSYTQQALYFNPNIAPVPSMAPLGDRSALDSDRTDKGTERNESEGAEAKRWGEVEVRAAKPAVERGRRMQGREHREVAEQRPWADLPFQQPQLRSVTSSPNFSPPPPLLIIDYYIMVGVRAFCSIEKNM